MHLLIIQQANRWICRNCGQYSVPALPAPFLEPAGGFGWTPSFAALFKSRFFTTFQKQAKLMYIITYDILFGQDASLTGDAERYLILRKGPLQSALAKILVRKGAKRIEDLMAQYLIYDVKKPRYVRVNTLKLDVETAMFELGKENAVQKDDMIPNLLVLPPGTDLHNHPLVTDGSVFM